MGFLNDLKSGKNGNIKITLPNYLKIDWEYPKSAKLLDAKNGSNWHLSERPILLNLQTDNVNNIFRNAEIIAKADFEEFFEYLNKDNIDAVPRTNDEKWSAIIVKKIVKIDGSDALYVIRRLTYQPGEELLVGQLLIPTQNATYQIELMSKAATTGMKESIMMAKGLIGTPTETVEELKESIAQKSHQEIIDAEENDALFEGHPLTVIRKSLNELVENQAIRIMQPYKARTEKEIILPIIGCAIRPPSVFEYSPLMTAYMNPNIAIFSNSTIPSKGSFGDFGNISVWRVDKEQIEGLEALQKLESFAIESLEGWKNEGVTSITIASEIIRMDNDKAVVFTSADFIVAEQNTTALAYWFLDDFGRIFRIDISGARSVSKEYLKQRLDQTFKTWRLLSAEEIELHTIKEVSKSKIEDTTSKKWWQFWK